MPKLSGFFKKFKIEDKNNKLISFCIDNKKLLEKYKVTLTKTEEPRKIELNSSVYDDKCIKTELRTYGYKVYTNFCGLNVPQYDIECEFLPSILLILYLFMKTNITFKYI